MMGPRQEAQGALFYDFSLEDHVPRDHLLRSIDRFVDLSRIRPHLAPYYSQTGRPSIDPELLIRAETSEDAGSSVSAPALLRPLAEYEAVAGGAW